MEEGKKIKFMIFLLAILETQILTTRKSTVASSSFQPNKHFVLVHGACHGAWSWYKLVALLRLSGHKVTALDLAALGINSKQFNGVKTISDYFQPLMDFVGSLPPHQRVILVAHSFGGLAISQAMEMYPEKVAVAVFVTVSMPGPHFNVSTLNKESLRRQGTLQLTVGIYTAMGLKILRLHSSKKYGSVKRVFIISEEDKLIARKKSYY